ncbi:hypothetical protein PIB30_047448 [Stylosanthes scabra]|uniref:protein-disulfide reductase n=1 Tax=Stylosanthes scabra TaxID=79078 RepID=A0ABU6WGT3_9FABA|nr:hypothetical protein [Stylosanthes scabra]
MEDVAVAHDVLSLLSSPHRDFLIRNNGDQVKIESLKGKNIGLYFSGSWCGPCRRFTPNLVEVYDETSSKAEFEVVFVTSDRDEDSFKGYFSKMPWLAIPFSDSETISSLKKLFQVRGIPSLVLLDQAGQVVTKSGVMIIHEHGAEAYPFTSERIQQLQEEEEEARRNQTLRSILASRSRDFVLSSDGKKVAVSELEGKVVGLYFYSVVYEPCVEFTPKLLEAYEKLRQKGESFEIVAIPLDSDEESFKKGVENVPWLSLPFKDKSIDKLPRYFELSALPTLVIIGEDGKTLHSNVAEAVEEHGIAAYPFTPDKFAELSEIEKAKEESQTLESILVSGEHDFVIGKDGVKVPVSELVGKTILLYFSAHWCPPCRAFLPKLIDAYHKIKEKDNNALEVIFISSDRDQDSFDKFFGGMPWLALPFGDSRKAFLSRKFKVSGIPMLVAIGSSGRTVTKEARDLIDLHGADAYPFTEERIKELEAEEEETAKAWPQKLKHESHEHELVVTRRRTYVCDGCDEQGRAWSFYCAECDFDLHPKCALENKESKDDDEAKNEDKAKDGWVCDGEVCTKA